MKIVAKFVAAVLLVAGSHASGQVIVADNYNLAGNGTGFGLGAGVNSGINPPATRITGSAALNLRYLLTGITKTNTAFALAGNKLQVAAAPNPGRFTFSSNGSTPFDFASAVGASTATPQNPAVYDLRISMANNSAAVQRMSFALGTTEGDATTWDFGIQLYRRDDTDTFYVIGKRIDTGSSGLASDLNTFVTNTAIGTYGTELSVLMRVTDAGTETNSYSSRLQLSLDGGSTWYYDTSTDSDLPNGWRLNGPSRYIMWDVAPDAGPVTYDSFSLLQVPVSVALVAPVEEAPNVGTSPTLRVAVSNSVPGNLTLTFYGREAPRPYPGRDFLMAVLPDTQNYARENSGIGDAVKEMWFAQTDWVVDNRVSQNIAYLAHLGDVVQNGDTNSGSPNTSEWRNATNAMYRLENPARTLLKHGLPYGVAVGNHDQDPIDSAAGTTTFYNLYFGVSHFQGKPYYGGHYGGNNDNHFDCFSASGLDFIVLYFENDDNQNVSVLNWADAVLSTNQHRRAIVVVHNAGSPTTPSNFSNQGRDIYDALKVHTNFFLMLGGHVDGEGSRSDTYNGKTVRTFISDYQFGTNGGDGWMRLMYFSPSNNTVTVKTYSPWLDRYRTDANSQMSFSYNLQLPSGPGSTGTPYVALATNTAVVAGGQSSCVWRGLQPNRNYDWYVVVTDQAGNTSTSSVWRLTTGVNTAPIASNVSAVVVGDQPAQLNFLGFDSNGDALTYRTGFPSQGLISNLDTNSGTLTYLPARGYRGSDVFTYQVSDGALSSSIAMVNLMVVAPADSNTNGLPDAWEAVYGITDPQADPDSDGESNLAEYRANTNPTNAASVLKVLAAGRQPNGNFGLTWSSVGGTRYRVQTCEGDAGGGVTDAFTDVVRFINNEMDPSPFGVSSTQTFSDTFAPNGASTNRARYYRIKVLP